MSNLLVPFYRLRVTGGGCERLLVDAYFIKSVEFPPRRLLLLMPDKGFSGEALTGGRVIEPSVSPDDVASLLRDTFKFLSGYRLPSIQSRLLKSRLNLTIPPKDLKINREESEVRGALLICGKVFGNALSDPESIRFEAQSMIRLGVNVDLRSFEWGGKTYRYVKVRGPKPLPRMYEYLYRVDEGFKDAMNRALGVASD